MDPAKAWLSKGKSRTKAALTKRWANAQRWPVSLLCGWLGTGPEPKAHP